jgi:hypothetical protein
MRCSSRSSKQPTTSTRWAKTITTRSFRSYGELNKGFQAITARMTDYSKRAFEDAIRTFEQLVGVKSLEQAIEIQSQYAKRSYDNWVAEASKLSEMCAEMARDSYRPVEQAVSKKLP